MNKFFSPEDEKNIVKAIADAESNTSGEIRLHVDSRCKADPKDEAIKIFEKLGMTKTELRNGVLIYLAVQDKKFAIIGDAGINNVVPDDFWNSVRDEMTHYFKQNQFVTGVIRGISQAGEKLKAHFPFKEGDQNELSNEISFGE